MDLSGNPAAPAPGEVAPGEGTDELLGFKSQAELAVAYKALRTKMSAGSPPAGTPPAAKPSATTGVALDFEALGQEVAQFGALSAQSRATAVKAGIPESVLDNYVKGLSSTRETTMSVAHTEAGGKEQYDALVNWAKGALDQPTKSFLEGQFQAGGEQSKRAIRTMKSMFEEANGRMPGVTLGGKPNGLATGAFASLEERKAAFADPKYRTDKVYRAAVEARMALGIRRS